VVPKLGQTARAALLSPQPLPPQTILIPLLNEIAVVLDPFILVLDDYHEVDARPVDELLTFLLEHLHVSQVPADFLGRIIGEKLEQGVFDGEQTLGNCQTDRARGEALAERKEHMGCFQPVGVPPAFGDHHCVPQQHQTVQRLDVLLSGRNEILNGCRGDALGFRRAAGDGLK
jgi:hypothetical protein